jgi:hypothetical protein
MASSRKSQPEWKSPRILLCLDPGDTTGYAIFEAGVLVDGGQIPGTDQNMERLILLRKPSVIVCEQFVNYPWKQASLAWSTNKTSKLIGVLEFICRKAKIPFHLQTAQLAKGFVTDKLLKEWGYYNVVKRHMNDATRHGCYYLLFHKD